MQLSINGFLRDIRASPDTPLLWVLRDELGLTGTKYGCGNGICGVCTVHFEGAAVASCMLTVADAQGAAIVTIEGLAAGESLHPVQQAWLDAGVSQCGYCQPGMIMAAAALLTQTSHPTESDLAAGLTVQCRCGTYPRVLAAMRRLAVR
jgi:isoquinoline 1-oxidoreductase subunit alpha